CCLLFFFQAEDGIRDGHVTGVQTCALPILSQRQESSPGEPVAAASSRRLASTDRRIITAHVCQPLAIRPPKMLRRAASRSVWNRSEERRVGKEWRAVWAPWPEDKNDRRRQS